MSRASFKVEIPNNDTEGVLKRAKEFLATIKYEETKPETPNTCLFRRGMGALTAPKFIELSLVHESGRTYLKCDGYVTFNLLFTVGKIGELEFTDGLGYGAIPRKTGFKDLAQLKEYIGGGDIFVDPGKPANRVMLALAVIIPVIFLLVCCTCYVVIAFSEYLQ